MFKVCQNKENDFVTDAYRVCSTRSEIFDEICQLFKCMWENMNSKMHY